jgi:hypothetical protein
MEMDSSDAAGAAAATAVDAAAAGICIICYDTIDKRNGDYRSDFCETCKYDAHISCIEDYISHQTNDVKCLLCYKVIEPQPQIQTSYPNPSEIRIEYDRMNINAFIMRLQMERRNNIIQTRCNVIFFINFMICIIIIIINKVVS